MTYRFVNNFHDEFQHAEVWLFLVTMGLWQEEPWVEMLNNRHAQLRSLSAAQPSDFRSRAISLYWSIDSSGWCRKHLRDFVTPPPFKIDLYFAISVEVLVECGTSNLPADTKESIKEPFEFPGLCIYALWLLKSIPFNTLTP